MRLPHKKALAEDQHCSPASKLFAVFIALSLTALLTPNTLFSRATTAKTPQLETNSSQTEEAAAPSQPASSIEIPDAPHRLHAPHWSAEDGLTTLIYIRNVHVSRPIRAKLSLVLGHRILPLPESHIDSLQTVAIDVSKALTENGERVEQSGAAFIDFEAESAGAISAYAQVLDTNKSLGLYFAFIPNGTAPSGPLDGVAWYYSKNVDAFVALQNTTEMTTTVIPTVFNAGETVNLGRRRLKPHQAITIKLPPPRSNGNKTDFHSAGVRLEHDGNPGAVVAQGWLLDKTIGFSTTFAFRPTSNCECSSDIQHLHGTGVDIGFSAAMGTTFSPFLAAYNRSAQPLTITPVFKYFANGRSEKVALPLVSLDPQQSVLVNLREHQENGIIPSWVEVGGIDLQYKGEASALVAELESIDESGSMISKTALTCRGNRDLYMPFWRTDADWQSSVTLENIATEENDVEITISYPGGVYLLNRKLAAGEMTKVSINELQQLQAADQEGRRIPADATVGGINIWSRNLTEGLVIKPMLVNPATMTCGMCIGNGYVTQYSVSDKPAFTWTPLYAGFDLHPWGDRFQIYMNVQYSSGTRSGDSVANSSSSNTTVATTDYSGMVDTLTTGQSNISAQSQSGYFTDPACSQTGTLSSTALLTVTSKVTVNSVGFTGDHQITRWPSGAVIDSPDGSAPTWSSKANPNLPVSYTKGALPTLFAKLGINPALSSLPAKIRVKNGTTVIAEKNVTLSGSSLTVTGINVTSALENNVRTTTPNFTWEISYNNGTSWRSFGSSGPHTMHWTYAAPLSPPFQQSFSGATDSALYDLALQKACGAANGATDVTTIVSQINQQVATDTFYDPGRLLAGHSLNAYTNQCLCADLASLLRGIIRSIGIDGSVQYIWAGPNSTTWTQFIVGSLGNMNEDNPTFRIIRGAQDGALTNPHFTYHAVVPVGGTLYDPSYGLSYPSLLFDETAFMSTPQQTSTTFASFTTQSSWVCPH